MRSRAETALTVLFLVNVLNFYDRLVLGARASCEHACKRVRRGDCNYDGRHDKQHDPAFCGWPEPEAT